MRFKKANFPQKFVKMLVNPTGLTALLPFLAKNLHFLNSTTRFAVTKIKDFDGCRMGVVTQIRRERPMCRSDSTNVRMTLRPVNSVTSLGFKGALQKALTVCFFFCRAGFLMPPLPKGRGTA